jgi:phytol kinase
MMGALAILQRRRSLHPEWARKLMHIGSGLVALSLPWLFAVTWPVLVLTVLASGGMLAVKYWSTFRTSVGTVTGSVVRPTLGEVWFPLGAGLVFVLADGDKLLYSIPILILTFADASAALVGIFYGRFQYSTSEGAKTLEGSLVFFQTAFLSALIPILLFTTIGRPETLMIALLMALLAMLLDALAWWGLDNLLIPVLSFLMLQVFVTLDAQTLLVQFIVTMLMIIFALIWRKRTTLNDSALMGTVFYGYLCWTLGGWLWVLPPLLLFLSYNLLSPPDVKREERTYSVQVMLGVGAVGLAWLMLADIFNAPALFFPFLLSFATQLAMIGSSRYLAASDGISVPLHVLRSVLLSWLIYLVPFAFIVGWQRMTWIYLIAGLLGISVGAAVFAASQTGPDGYRDSTTRWIVQTLSAGLASGLGFAAMQIA